MRGGPIILMALWFSLVASHSFAQDGQKGSDAALQLWAELMTDIYQVTEVDNEIWVQRRGSRTDNYCLPNIEFRYGFSQDFIGLGPQDRVKAQVVEYFQIDPTLLEFPLKIHQRSRVGEFEISGEAISERLTTNLPIDRHFRVFEVLDREVLAFQPAAGGGFVSFNPNPVLRLEFARVPIADKAGQLERLLLLMAEVCRK